MNKKEIEEIAVEAMNEDPNKFMPPEVKNNLDVIELRTNRVNSESSRITKTYGGGLKALTTVVNRSETADQDEEEIIDYIYSELSKPPSPQCKKLFKYDGSWRDVEDKSDYKFVNCLELIIKNDGYVLQPRFE